MTASAAKLRLLQAESSLITRTKLVVNLKMIGPQYFATEPLLIVVGPCRLACEKAVPRYFGAPGSRVAASRTTFRTSFAHWFAADAE
jgi:hypothetical protein